MATSVLIAQNVDLSLSLVELDSLRIIQLEKGELQDVEDIKNELERRKSYEIKLADLERDINSAAELENYDEAASLNEIKDQLEKKESKRLELYHSIYNAVINENYEGAAKHQNELTDLDKIPKSKDLDKTKPVIVETPDPEPVPVTMPVTPAAPEPTSIYTTPNYNATTTKEFSGAYSGPKMILSYQLGVYAPFGIMIGSVSENLGFYFSLMANSNLFSSSYTYEINSGVIDGLEYTWDYANEQSYSRADILVGLNYKLAGDVSGTSLHGYFGVGYGVADYYHLYNRTGISYTDQTWVYNKDVSSSFFNTDIGAILNLSGFNLSIGVAAFHTDERMVAFGIGFNF